MVPVPKALVQTGATRKSNETARRLRTCYCVHDYDSKYAFGLVSLLAIRNNGTYPREADMEDISEQKRALRHIVIARRDALPIEERAHKSAEICRQLKQELLDDPFNTSSDASSDTVLTSSLSTSSSSSGILPSTQQSRPSDQHRSFDRAKTVGVYAAMGSEADPAAFTIAAEQAGWRVAYPCMLPSDEVESCGQRMCMRLVAANERQDAPFILRPTRPISINALDRERYPVVSANELDALVVPLVAFDADGMRLGYGGGCYDRFLPALAPTCKIVGIAYEEQRFERVPSDAHDHTLPYIISA